MILDEILSALECDIAARRFAHISRDSFERMSASASGDRAPVLIASITRENARLREIDTEIARLCRQVIAAIEEGTR